LRRVILIHGRRYALPTTRYEVRCVRILLAADAGRRLLFKLMDLWAYNSTVFEVRTHGNTSRRSFRERTA
jgi:hypothetical protein